MGRGNVERRTSNFEWVRDVERPILNLFWGSVLGLRLNIVSSVSTVGVIGFIVLLSYLSIVSSGCMRIQKLLWTLVFVSLVVLSGCGKKASSVIDFGQFEGSKFTHEFLGFTIQFPDEWFVMGHHELEAMAQAGGQLLAGGDENLKATFDAAELNSVNLFNVSQYEMGAAVPSNPSITSVAERVAHMPGVKLGSDYLFHAKNLLEQSALQLEFPKEVYQVTLGGRVFHVMELQMIFPGVAVNQKYFACVEKRYALSFITTFNTPEEGEMLDAILDTLVFSE